MFEFWGESSYALTDNPAAMAQLKTLPKSGHTDPECLHMPAGTRVRRPSPPVAQQGQGPRQLLQRRQAAAPASRAARLLAAALGFGGWGAGPAD